MNQNFMSWDLSGIYLGFIIKASMCDLIYLLYVFFGDSLGTSHSMQKLHLLHISKISAEARKLGNIDLQSANS
jgi:hypothetical protein